MSCVYETFSNQELIKRKEYLCKQLQKIDYELEKRIYIDENIDENIENNNIEHIETKSIKQIKIKVIMK
jgi:hypothetical protein